MQVLLLIAKLAKLIMELAYYAATTIPEYKFSYFNKLREYSSFFQVSLEH